MATTAEVKEGTDRAIPEALKESLIRRGYRTMVASLEMRGRVPTMSQWPILTSPAATNLVCGGVRAGKSVVVTDYELGHKRFGKPELIWLGAASYELTKPEFDYIADGMAKMGQLRKASKRVDPGYIELKDGTIYETKSGADPRTWAGKAPNRVYILEAAQTELDIYYRAHERLIEVRALDPTDGQLFMAGTLEGSLGWYPRFFEMWKEGLGEARSFSLPTWSNDYLFPGGREDPEILRMEREMPDDRFREHVAGEPVAPAGLVFSEFRPDLHVKPVVYEPDLPVYMWVDPGYGGACDYLFAQRVNGQVRVFAEIYERGKTVEDVVQIITGSGQWSHRYPVWKHATGQGRPGIFATEDRYGDQHHHNSSVAEVWISMTGLALNSFKVRSINDVDTRIHSFLKVDPLTGQPGVVFDPSCKGILSNFGACLEPFSNLAKPYRWKTGRDGEVYGNTPDQVNCDGIRALGYGLVGEWGYVEDLTSRVAKVVYH